MGPVGMAQLSGAQDSFFLLAVALAIGLLIGLERGWSERHRAEGERVAGIRTFGLLGILGGAVGLLAQEQGALVFGLGLLAVAGVQITAYISARNDQGDIGITSLVAGILTFTLGALAASGFAAPAAALAVVAATLLRFKPVLHGWLEKLEGRELNAGLTLLLLSVVVLPILPDRGFGPWQALNPAEIWLMVVLIATISFAGYFAVRIGGTERGIVFTGLFAGLMSSTALTLQFARLARQQPGNRNLLAVGILLACGTMFPRMVVVASLFNAALLATLWPAALLMTVVVYGSAGVLWWQTRGRNDSVDTELGNPLEIKSALSFGALLAGVMLLGSALKAWLGDRGILLLAAASGVADVDAITLSLARMSSGDLAVSVATAGIIIGAAVNSVVKGSMAALIGGGGLGLRAGLPLLLAALAGLLLHFLMNGSWG